ncbi:Helicase associated domain protein [Embleya sp. MST-111070]|uniref:helicase associated domain-containing protein n=1 Tax=Embleya sp. MST-111070 TaxID=3398231 RepID=UPI003F741083
MTRALADRRLFPHQREAVDKILKVLAENDRTTAVMACGTGKTRVGGEVAHLVAHAGAGHALVMVPTLELIGQTIREWREHLGDAALGRVVAVCSDREVLARDRGELAVRGAAVTTDPAQLARLVAEPGPVTLACTYHSLPVLAEAHARYGLAAADIAVIDEAHRTAGVPGRPWAAVHDDSIVRARRRLYLTATPRVVVSDQDDVVSMSDERVFGPVAHRLAFSTAIHQLGLLASYRLVIAVVTSDEVRALMGRDNPYLRVGNAAVSAPALAAQVAVLRAARTHDIRRMITFHRRVADARWFSTMLPDAMSLLDPAERPSALWSGHVHGKQDGKTRRAVLDRLGSDDEGLVVVTNARVLSEGVDVPAIDAVCFLDPRSTIDTIQAVGRALRRTDRTRPKTASIVVPVLLDPDEDPESALASGRFGPVWQTVRALAAHDEDLARQLEQARRAMGETSAGPGLQQSPGQLPSWLSVTGIPVPPGFADAVSVRTVRMTTSSWEENVGRAAAFHAREGHLAVPHTDPLATWIGHLRQFHAKGTLAPERVDQMEALGMIWSVPALKLHRLVEELRAFERLHGHLRIPNNYTVHKPNEEPYKLGQIAKFLRVSHVRGEVPPEKVAVLTAEGFVWDTAAHDWEQFCRDLAAFKEEHGHLDVPQDATRDGRPIGQTVSTYRMHPDRLTNEQRARLDTVGFVWSALEYRYQLHLEALKTFRSLHGHARVPRRHVVPGPVPLRLGQWLTIRRTDYRKGRLSEARYRQLLALGVEFTIKDDAAR